MQRMEDLKHSTLNKMCPLTRLSPELRESIGTGGRKNIRAREHMEDTKEMGSFKTQWD